MQVTYPMTHIITNDDPTLPPRYVVDSFKRAFEHAYGREASIRYIGNHWYHVNGETVHRVMLMEEIIRLHELEQQKPPPRAERSVIQRLIAKLKAL
jgi:hypothetical protein